MGYKINTSGDKAYFSLNNKKNQESSVMFLIDISGSMDGDKLNELKRVSKETIQEVINNNSEVSITAFSGECNVPIQNELSLTKDFNEVEYFIDNLYARLRPEAPCRSQRPKCARYDLHLL